MKISELFEDVNHEMPIVVSMLSKVLKAGKKVKFETQFDSGDPIVGIILDVVLRDEIYTWAPGKWCKITYVTGTVPKGTDWTMPRASELERATLKKTTEDGFDYIFSLPNEWVKPARRGEDDED